MRADWLGPALEVAVAVFVVVRRHVRRGAGGLCCPYAARELIQHDEKAADRCCLRR